MTVITICGYPRSGNTWLGRLLADVLGCGYVYNINGVPEFTGDKTPAPYEVHKSHLTESPDPARTIFIYRDPRDVAVSIAHYTHNGYLLDAIESMKKPSKLFGVGRYLEFMQAWWYSHRAALEVRYCDLHEAPLPTFERIVSVMAGYSPTRESIERALERQSLESAKRKYAPTNHLRNGNVGEWREYFTGGAARVFHQVFGQLLIDQGFEPDDSWLDRYR